MNAHPTLVPRLRMNGHIPSLPKCLRGLYRGKRTFDCIPAHWSPHVEFSVSYLSFPKSLNQRLLLFVFQTLSVLQAPGIFSESTWPIKRDVLMWAGFIWRFLYCGSWRRAIGYRRFTNETYPPLKMEEQRLKVGNRIPIDKTPCPRRTKSSSTLL